MKTLYLVAVPALLLGAPARVARVGELEGKVEVQLHPGDAWRPAVRNLPLVQSTWVRTGPAARIEMESDDGGVLRLSGDALCEFSDYTRLSTGQRVTMMSLDHGVAYYTGEPDRRDAIILAVPGAQATVRSGSRVRLEALENGSHIAVLEGVVRFSSPSAELDLREGQTVRVEAAAPSRFFLYREITPLDSDKWNEQRDKMLAATGSAKHVPGVQYGLADLDAAGSWITTSDYGLVWKPKVAPGWVPYRDGAWLWYDEFGYTWVANETWGWLPFHYGRWTEQTAHGWVWSPEKSGSFKPGEVYWLRETNLVGWGPLAPGEKWDARSTPRNYLRVNTTLAQWKPDIRELTSAEPAEKLKTTQAVFVVAPPSPAFDAARLDVARPILRAGSTRIVPIIPGVTYAPGVELAQMPVPETPPMPPQPSASSIASDVTISPQQHAGPAAEVYIPVPVPEPVEVYYPVPVYSGVIVVNPPERPDKRHPPQPPPVGMPRGENREHRPRPGARAPEPPIHTAGPSQPAPPAAAPPPATRPPAAQPPATPPPQAARPGGPMPRYTDPPRATAPPQHAAPPPASPAPIPRTSEPPRAAPPPQQRAPDPPRAAPPPPRPDPPPRSNDDGGRSAAARKTQ